MTSPHSSIILASKSKSRQAMLAHAGLSVRAVPADIDERAIESKLDHDPQNLARELARQKALAVASEHTDALVIGSDSLVELDGEVLHKAANREEALTKLMKLSGKTHHLISSVAVVKGRIVLWDHTQSAALTMRSFDEDFARRYLDVIGEEAATSCVGSYQLEAHGPWLFEKIEGDYFTILGMPLIALLGYLQDYHEVSL